MNIENAENGKANCQIAGEMKKWIHAMNVRANDV